MLDGPRIAPLAGGKARALIVLVHGYGSNGEEMMHVAAQARYALPTVAFVAPNAPGRLAPLADGRRWWPLDSFAPAALAAGVAAAVPELDAFLTHEPAAHGLADDRLLLIGFSQGMMMALHVGLRRAKPLAGIVGISGMLVAPKRLAAEIRSRPSVLLVHGSKDNVVPFREMDVAASALRAVDVEVETHVSQGTGHGIAPDGAAATAAFAARMLETAI